MSYRFSLTHNFSETRLMVISRTHHLGNIIIYEEAVQKFHKDKCLGTMVNGGNNDCIDEIKSRTG